MKIGRRSRVSPRCDSRRAIVIAMVGMATIGGLVFGSGAWAERLASVKPKSLEELLSERQSYGEGEYSSPAREQLLDRYESLRRRRLRVEGGLPPAVKPGLERRPTLEVPSLLVPIKRPAREVDRDRTNPDGVVRGGTE